MVGVLHGVDHEADQQVDHCESCHEDEGQEEGPCVGVDFHHGAHDPHGPAFERHDLEECVGGCPERAEPLREGIGEEFCGDDGADVEDQAHQHEDRAHAGHRCDEAFDHAAQRRSHRDHPEHPQDAQRAHCGEALARRDERNGDYHKVEYVPARAEKAGAVGDELGE